MGPQERFDIFIEKHIGFGIRWDSISYKLHISIAIMCVTINIGIGKNLQNL